MKQEVILNIFNKPTRVELTIGKRDSRTYHLCYGIISCTISSHTSLETLKSRLERVYPESTIKKINNEPFFVGGYAYVFGDLIPVGTKLKKEPSITNSYVLVNGSRVTLLELFEAYVEGRVKYYEELMHTVPHEVHVKRMSSQLGNNHYLKHILNFDYNMVHFSKALIDSVIVHELAHDFEHNHSPNFYNIVNQYCLNYKEKRNKLLMGVRK